MTNNPNLDLSPDNIARVVVLVFGKLADARPFWCFVTVKPSRRADFNQKVQTKTLDLTRYVEDGFGEIVVSGESLMPPREVLKDVATLFNVPIRQLFADFDFDAEITKEIEKLKKELGDA